MVSPVNGWTEALLQYAWQTQQFDLRELRTTTGEPIRVLHPGRWNPDGGPDFRDAELEIAGQPVSGDVELHLASAGWYQHGHQADPAYNRVVLHVVLTPGTQPIQRADTQLVPEAVLHGLVAPNLLARAQQLAPGNGPFPCAHQVQRVADFPKRRWLHSLGLNRLVRKAEALEADWHAAHKDWNQAFWQGLCAAMGAPQNRQPFRRLAEALPIAILQRMADQPELLEAALLGVAGWLEAPPADAYSATLQQHWLHLQHKHQLKPLHEPNWQLLRMRPANFPTIRAAQLAGLLHRFEREGHGSLIRLVDLPVAAQRQLLNAEASPYWHTHYKLGGASTQPKPKRMGADLQMRLLINLVAPFGMLYHKARGEADAAASMAQRLSELPAERNAITDTYAAHGLKPRHALESQALLDLKHDYCDARRCLSCGIGHELLKAAAG